MYAFIYRLLSYGTSSVGTSTPTTLDQYMQYLEQGKVDGFGSTLDGLAQPAEYIFQTLDKASPLLGDVSHPDIFNPKQTDIILNSVQFYLGPGGTGAPMHFHRAAYNVLVHGRKLWKMQPPKYAYFSKQHPQDLFETDRRPKDPMFECTQEPGDVMFVPEMWGHSTMNVVESIGFSVQFDWGASEFSLQEDLMESEQLRIKRKMNLQSEDGERTSESGASS